MESGRCVDLLLRSRAKIDVVDCEGRSPLILACRAGKPDAVRLLLRANAVTSATCCAGKTALDHAEERLAGTPGDTPQHYAYQLCVKQLLKEESLPCCAYCGGRRNSMGRRAAECAGCDVSYCSREHQRWHWATHKHHCGGARNAAKGSNGIGECSNESSPSWARVNTEYEYCKTAATHSHQPSTPVVKGAEQER